MAAVTFFHAHPDDEAIATGGTMAALAAQGHRVVLVTATGGELGEIPDGLLRPGETLAERRAAELAEAAAVLGVDRQLWLGYEDSGMEGEPSSLRPGCFATADVEEAALRLAGILTAEGSEVLVTYDEHGGYGHPDHVQVHTVGMRAAALAGTPVVYLATVDRGFMENLRTLMADSGWTPSEQNQEQMEGADTMGEPSERITTEVDVTAHLTTKRAAMRAQRVRSARTASSSPCRRTSSRGSGARSGTSVFALHPPDSATGGARPGCSSTRRGAPWPGVSPTSRCVSGEHQPDTPCPRRPAGRRRAPRSSCRTSSMSSTRRDSTW